MIKCFINFFNKFIRLPFCAMLAVMIFASVLYADGAIIISDFAEDTSGWIIGENVASVERVDFTWKQDGNEYSRSCLEVLAKRAQSDTLRSVVTSFDSPLNLKEYREVSFDIYVPSIANDAQALFLVRLTLISQNGDSTEHLEAIEAGKWNNINAKIGTWDGREAVTGAEIALAVDTVLTDYPADSFYIDDVVTSKQINQEMITRFLFDEYTVQGGTATVSDDKARITLTHENDGEMSFDVQTYIPEKISGSNKLRIRLANHTENTAFTLYYSTSDSQATTEDKSVELQMLPHSDFTDYYVNVGDINQLHKIKLVFAPCSGHVELASISVIPEHDVFDYDFCGKFISCRLSPDASSITFAGEVEQDVAAANQSGYIGIYEYAGKALPTKEQLEAITPVVKGGMATRYEMSWQVPKNSLYMTSSAFIAAIVSQDGSYRFISPPFYAENLEVLASGEFVMNADAKGYSANDISSVGDSDTGITLIDININEVFAQDKKPQMYSYRGSMYYFNAEYLEAISSKLSILKKSGTQILLRLSFGDVNTDIPYLDNDATGDDYIGAISAYVANSWVSDGTVIGVVYGDGENRIDDEDTFSDNIQRTAKNLRSVYINLIQANSKAKVYISLTDKYSAEVQNGVSEIGLTEYIPALISETALYTQFPWEIAIECCSHDEQAHVGDTFIDITSCDEIRDLLADCGLPGKHMIFIDKSYSVPDANKGALITDYVVGTYTSRFADDIDAYIALAGIYSERISEAVRYMYTSEAYVVENITKKNLGVDDISEAVLGYDEKKVEHHFLGQIQASEEMPDGIKGKFTYYRFDSIAGIGGFYPSYYSSDFRIVNDEGSVLSIQLSASDEYYGANAEWMGAANTLAVKEDLRLTPVLALTLCVEAVTPDTASKVPVKMVLKSDTERFEAVASVTVGKWTTLYIDTNSFNGAKDTSKMEILAGDTEISSAVLKLHSIEGLSREYNDESLAQVIEKARADRTSTETAVDFGMYLPIGIAAVVVVVTVVAVVLLSRKKNSKD